MAAENVRVDTTFIGWFLIGFILLMFGVLGLQWGDVFGDVYKDYPLDGMVFMQVAAVVGLILILLTIFAYRTGKGATAVIFAFTGLFFIVMYYHYKAPTWNSSWFIIFAFAVFYAILAIYAFMAKVPKFVTVALVLLAFTALFTALGWGFEYYGPWDNFDCMKAMCIVSGIFSFLGFLVATYLGLAYANPKKVPLI